MPEAARRAHGQHLEEKRPQVCAFHFCEHRMQPENESVEREVRF
jgi:hypothetical protein